MVLAGHSPSSSDAATSTRGSEPKNVCVHNHASINGSAITFDRNVVARPEAATAAPSSSPPHTSLAYPMSAVTGKMEPTTHWKAVRRTR